MSEIMVNSDYFLDLSHDEQIVILIIAFLNDGITNREIEVAGMSEDKFTRALSHLYQNGMIVNHRSKIEFGRRIWKPQIIKPIFSYKKENVRIMKEDVLFSKKLRTKQLSKLIYFHLNNGEPSVFFYRKRIEYLLRIPGTTAKWNIRALDSSGLAEIKKKPGSQGLIITFQLKPKGFLKSLFS